MDEPAPQAQIQPETGLLVVARTKLVDQTGNVTLQTQDPHQHSPLTPSHTPQQSTRDLQVFPQNQHRNPQDERTIVKVKMLLPPLKEPVPYFPSSPGQKVGEAQSEPVMQTSGPNQQDRPSPPSTQTGPPPQKVLALSKQVISQLTEGKGSSTLTQTPKSKSSIRDQPKPPLVNAKSQKPPIVVHSEVHSRAQSMARSRLEKARVQLHVRIQQAIKLFGGKEMTESQAKKKQVQFQILKEKKEFTKSLKTLIHVPISVSSLLLFKTEAWLCLSPALNATTPRLYKSSIKHFISKPHVHQRSVAFCCVCVRAGPALCDVSLCVAGFKDSAALHPRRVPGCSGGLRGLLLRVPDPGPDAPL